MTCGPRVRISPSDAIITSIRGMTGPTVPTPRRCIHGDDRRGLGEAVSLQDLDAGADEEGRKLGGQRRAAGDDELHAATQPRDDLAEDELVRNRRLHLEAERHRLAVDAV